MSVSNLFDVVGSMLPYALLYLILFWKYSRASRQVLAVSAIGVTLIVASLLSFLFNSQDDAFAYDMAVGFSGILLGIAGWFFVRISVPVYVYTLVLVFQMAVLVQGVSIFLQYSLGITSTGLYTPMYYIPLALDVLLVPPALLIRRALEQSIQKFSTHPLWLELCLPSLITTMALLSYFSHLVREYQLFETWVIVLYAVLLTTSVLTQVVSISIVTQAIRGEEYKRKLKEADALLELQKAQYRALTERIEQARQARHDMRHQVMLLEGMAQNAHPEETKAILKEMRASIPEETESKYSDHYAVNCILCEYVSHYANEDIRFELRLPIGEVQSLTDLELAVVVGNLMENACEAVLRLPKEQRVITALSKCTGSMLHITVRNPYDGQLRREDDSFYSFKRHFAEKGMGLQSVMHIAQQHGGAAVVKAEDNVFTVSVMLTR